jgi:hypothetical protein
MEQRKPRLFVEAFFAKCIAQITRCTAGVQARFIPRTIATKFDRSECSATIGILVAALILMASWMVSNDAYGAIILVKFVLGILALWYAIGAFAYPLRVVLVDLPRGGGLQSPVRSVILLFFNYAEITIHFASFYLLSESIEELEAVGPVTSAWTSLHFSIVTITTLGDGNIRPLWWMGRSLVSAEALVGLILIVTVLARFLNKCLDRGTIEPLHEGAITPVGEGAQDQELVTGPKSGEREDRDSCQFVVPNSPMAGTMEEKVAFVRNLPEAKKWWQDYALIIALLALAVSVYSASLSRQEFIAAHRPYVYPISRIGTDGRMDVKTILIGCLNAPARIIRQEVSHMVVKDRQDGKAEVIKAIPVKQPSAPTVLYPSETPTTQITIIDDSQEKLTKELASDPQLKLMRRVRIDYQELSTRRTYFAEANWDYSTKHGVWEVRDTLGN